MVNAILLITLESTLDINIFALQERRVYHKASKGLFFIHKNPF